VYGGYSLLSWIEYFPKATVTGFDIDLSNLLIDKKTPRMKLYRVNAASETNIKRILGEPREMFDFILDDASHFPEHQIESFRILAPYLKSDGIFIIEDIDSAHQDVIRESLTRTANQYNMSMDWYDLRTETNRRFDDIVAVMKRR
jgi:hypothetical protein